MTNNSNRKAKSFRAAPGRQTRVKKNRRGNPSLDPNRWRSPRMIMPPEFDTTLTYIVEYQVNNAAGPLASVHYDSNAYDVDPALGSSSMPGFTEMAAFYARFRTLGISYKFNVCNLEAFPVSVIHGFSNANIAANALSMVYAGNPLFRTSILGPLTGQCRGIYQQSASVGKISGSQSYVFDDTFTGSTTANTMPSTAQVHAYLGITSPNVVNLTNGIYAHIAISLRLRFIRPLSLLV